jgi:hypothetical protein
MSNNSKIRNLLAASAVILLFAIDPQLVRGNAQIRLQTLTGFPTGTTIPYTGELTGDDGNPVTDGEYDFMFALYEAAEGGNMLWSETQNGVSVAGGRFTVMLGSVNPLPPESKVTDFWLQISVRGTKDQNFVLLAPRQRLSLEAVDAPTSPSTVGTCPHNHFGEYWSSKNANYGLYINNTGAGSGIVAQTKASNMYNGAVRGSNTGAGSGVEGSSSTGFGVRALSDSSYGLWASSDSSKGVYAKSDTNDAIEASASTSGKSAVYAHNTAGYGVYAISNSGNGLYAESGSAAGVRAISNSGAAVNASSTSGVAVHASSASNDAIDATTSGTNKSAVFAHATNSHGVTARSDNYNGLQASGNETSVFDVYGDVFLEISRGELVSDGMLTLSSSNDVFIYLDRVNLWPNACVYAVDGAHNIINSIICEDGTKSAVIKTQDNGRRKVYTIESPEVWLEDFGSAALVNGMVTVTLEPIFAQTVNTDVEYHVFVTPLCQAPVILFVTSKTSTGFTVQGVTLDGSPSDCSFDYRISAKRLGLEDLRLEQVPDNKGNQ